VEIKTYSGYTTEPLPYWLDQCQAILACTDTDTLYLVWMDASMSLQWCEVDRDEVHIADMVNRAERFMAAIELGMMPDWVTPEARHVAALHPDPAGTVELDDATVALLAEFAEHRDAVKYHEAEMKTIKDQVAVVLGEHEAGIADGKTVVSWSKVKGRSSFDQAAFKADHPDMVARYTKTGAPSRRFMVNITGGNDD
jgi:predicted phage-related endonuclease